MWHASRTTLRQLLPIDPLGGTPKADFWYDTATQAVIRFEAANDAIANSYLAYNPDGLSDAETDAYNYESFYVLIDADKNAQIVVLVDNDAAKANVECFSYNAVEATADASGVPEIGA